MRKSNVVITGSCGRIGKILISRLSHEYVLYGLDRFEAPSTPREYTADIGNFEEFSKAFKKIHGLSGSIDAIIHLAADSRVDAPWDSVLRNNIISTRNLYECAQRHGVTKIVFFSTNHVTGGYEKDVVIPMITADHEIRPDGDYAASKVFGEALAREYWELYGIRSICLRIGSLLEDDNPVNSPRFMKTWLSHRDLAQLVKKSLESTIDFGVYYGVSNNDGRFWDIDNARTELGYEPQDNASLRMKN